MKKFFSFLIVVLIIGGVAVITCPDKQAHKDAIMAVVNESIDEELGVNDATSEDVLGLLGGISTIGSHVSEWFLDSNLTVENHFVYSEGILKHGKESDTVSIGVFGHVFTGGKEGVKKMASGKK